MPIQSQRQYLPHYKIVYEPFTYLFINEARPLVFHTRVVVNIACIIPRTRIVTDIIINDNEQL